MMSSLISQKLTPVLIKCTDRLIAVLNKKMASNEEFPVSETIKRYSMDTIWNCAFGVDIDVQQSERDIDYFRKSEQFFINTESLNIFSFIGSKGLINSLFILIL